MSIHTGQQRRLNERVYPAPDVAKMQGTYLRFAIGFILNTYVNASKHPAIETKLIFNICRELSVRLRRADAEIRSLAE